MVCRWREFALVRLESWMDGFALFFSGKALLRHSSRAPAIYIGSQGGAFLSRFKAKLSGEEMAWKAAGPCSIVDADTPGWRLDFGGILSVQVFRSQDALELTFSLGPEGGDGALRIELEKSGDEGHPSLGVLEGGKTVLVNSRLGPWKSFSADSCVDISWDKKRLKAKAAGPSLRIALADGPSALARTAAFSMRRWPGPRTGPEGLSAAEFLRLSSAPLPKDVADLAIPSALADRNWVVRWIDADEVPDADLCAEIGKILSEGCGFAVPIPQSAPSAALDLAMFSPWMVLPSRNLGTSKSAASLLRAAAVYSGLERYRKSRREAWLREGIPFWTHPSVYFQDDPALLSREDGLMLGPELILAIPWAVPGRARELLLPKGEWVHLWTSRKYPGGLAVVDAPPGLPAVFYAKEGRFSAYFDALRKTACRLPG